MARRCWFSPIPNSLVLLHSLDWLSSLISTVFSPFIHSFVFGGHFALAKPKRTNKRDNRMMDTKHMIIAKKKKKPEISSSSSSPTGILTISQLHFDVSCFYALVIPSSSSGKPWDSSPSVKMLLSSWPSEVSCSYGSLISSAGNDRSWNLNFYKPLIWVLNVDLWSVVAFIIYALVLSLSIYVSFLLNHNIRFWGQSHCLICLYSCYRRYNKHLLKKMNVYVQFIGLYI